MKCLAIKQLLFSSFMALFLSVCAMPAHAFSMSEMVGEYTSSNVSANSRSSKNSRRGFASGGSVRIRFENKPFPELYNVTLPSFKADCNGLDMSMGSLSWISADEFMQAARALASPGVLIYALSLALNQMCTPCAQEMAKLQDMLNGFQNMLKLSCEEIGTALYEHSGAKEGAQWVEQNRWQFAQEQSQNDDAETKGSVTTDALSAGAEGQELISENVIWDHLKNVIVGGWLGASAGEMVAKEMIMSLSGTVVTDAMGATVDTDVKRNPVSPVPPTLKSIVSGKEIHGLTCSDIRDCLVVEPGLVTTLDPMSETFFKMLDPASPDSISFKFGIHENGISLTDAEAAFLEAAKSHMDIVPTLRKLALSGRTMKSTTAMFLAEWIAIEIALEFMLDYVNTSQVALSNLDNTAGIPPRNIFNLRDSYRAEAKELRTELVEKFEAEANINAIIDSVMGNL